MKQRNKQNKAAGYSRSWRTRLKVMIAGMLYGLSVLAPVGFADDTEIFFGSGGLDTSGGSYPNLLLVVDTSGSMAWDTSGVDYSTNNGPIRMDEMKTALNSVLDSLNNINVGLMRFTRSTGGAVVYPVRYIDANASGAGQLKVSVESANNDAAENLSTNAVDLNGDTLPLSREVSTTGGIQITGNNLDAEEDYNGTVTDGGHYLGLGLDGYAGGPHISALRYRLNIPAGSVIRSAYIRFVSQNNTYTGNVNLVIQGEASANSAAFANTANNISSRAMTSAYVKWDNLPDWQANEAYNSPDIANIIQEIVNQSGWSANNYASIILSDNGSADDRQAYTYNSGGASRAPQLFVVYEPPAAPQYLSAVRFENVRIPRGAKITSAKLALTAIGGEGNIDLAIMGEAADDSAAFSSTARDLSNRTATTAYEKWSLDTTDTWNDTGSVKLSPDISSVVQEIVNRSGWCGGNSLTLMIKGDPSALGVRAAGTYDNSAGYAPSLFLEFDESSVPNPTCLSTQFSVQVNNDNDDAEQRSGSYSRGSSNLEMSDDDGRSSRRQVVGIRFRSVQVPQGASISNAYLTFTAYDTRTGGTNLKIYAEDTDSAGSYRNRSSSGPLYRTTTSNRVDWNNVERWYDENTYKSPDISSVIQEVINRPGWSPGNNLNILIKGGNGLRSAHSHDSNGAKAPRLVIEYQTDTYTPAASQTVREKLKEVVNDLPTTGGTPLVDTFYEAARYYRGEAIEYGDTRLNNSYNRVSHPLSYVGGTVKRDSACTDANLNASACASETIEGSPRYVSPIQNECQENHIVLITDGQANSDHSQSLIQSMIGASCANRSEDGEECGHELAQFLANEDQSGSIGQTNTITTHTIGFTFSTQWMEDLSTVYGGGQHFTASSAAGVVNAINQIVQQVFATDTSFVAPAATVNTFNRLYHRDDLFFAVFRPEASAKWNGNLKRYRYDVGQQEIVDVNDNPAVDDSTGFFKDTARSFWSSVVDGNDVKLGGAAEQIPSPDSRKVYTWWENSVNTTASSTLSSNPFTVANAEITKDKLNIFDADFTSSSEADQYREDLINWVRGVDVKDADNNPLTTERKNMGDPLHSRPVVVTYRTDAGSDGDVGTADDTQDMVLYVATNEGMLHAIDPSDGSEKWSFIPEELWGNLKIFYEDSSADKHPYGFDGPISVWIHDADMDGTIESGDHVYLYVGMRRGGANYYAFDVTDPDSPELKWVLKGNSTDFPQLAQSWSRMSKAEIMVGSTVKTVLIFGGGNDPVHDERPSNRATTTTGNAIYVVDAETGEKIWSASNSGASMNDSDMKYPIPSDVKVIDVNSDGLADQFYVGDLGGQVWRFDIMNGQSGNSLIQGGVIGDFGGSSTADHHRFYHAPDLIMMTTHTGENKLAVNIGSGWHAAPLDKSIDDAFFQIRQDAIFNPPDSYDAVTKSDLTDLTNDVIGSGGSSANSVLNDLADSEGWYIDLINDGEKVLASSTTLDNYIYFTTYTPEPNTLSCGQVGVGVGRVYAVSAIDGTSPFEDRSYALNSTAIPSTPMVMFLQDSNSSGTSGASGSGTGVGTALNICVGAECTTPPTDPSTLFPTYWYEEENPGLIQTLFPQ